MSPPSHVPSSLPYPHPFIFNFPTFAPFLRRTRTLDGTDYRCRCQNFSKVIKFCTKYQIVPISQIQNSNASKTFVEWLVLQIASMVLLFVGFFVFPKLILKTGLSFQENFRNNLIVQSSKIKSKLNPKTFNSVLLKNNISVFAVLKF